MGSRFTSPVILGRYDELSFLTAGLADAGNGQPVLTVIRGDAGLGKSRLISEFALQARSAGAMVLTGECVDVGRGEGLPFAPIAAMIRDLIRSLDRDDVRIVVGDAAVDLGVLVPDLLDGAIPARSSPGQGPDVTRIFERFRDVAERLGQRHSCLLIVEDVHWIDDASRGLLTFLARTLRTEHIMVVATFRTDHLPQGHPTYTWLAELARSPLANSIVLAPLVSDDIRAQITAIQGAAPTLEIASEIAFRSEGNPLFVEELLATTADATVPSSNLGQLLLSRTWSLSPETRDALGVAAVFARSFDERLLALIVGLDESQLVACVREAVVHNVLVPDGTRYRFRHALLREAIEADLTPGQQRDVHRRIAEVLSVNPDLADPSPAVAAGEAADHWLGADRPADALRATILAAAAAASVGAHEVAYSRYEQALYVADGLGVGDVEGILAAAGLDMVALRLQAGETAGRVARFARSTELIRSALAGVDASADPGRAGLIHSALSEALWEEGRVSESLNEQMLAVDLVPAEPLSVERARVLGGLVTDLSVAGRYREAVAAARETIAYAERVGAALGVKTAEGPPIRQLTRSDPIDFAEAIGQATMHLGLALTQLGATAEGIAVLRRAKAELEIGPLPDVTLHVISNLARCLLTVDELDEAVAVAREGLEETERRGLSAILAARFAWRAGLGLFRLGRWDEAEEVTAGSQQHGAQWQVVLAVRARIAAARGDGALAHTLLTESETGMVEGMDRLLLPQRIANAEVALADGDAGAALKAALDALNHPFPDLDLRLPLAWLGLRGAAELGLDARVRHDHAGEEAARVARDRLMAEIASDRRSLLDWDRLPTSLVATADLAEAESQRLDGLADPVKWSVIGEAFEAAQEPYPAAYARYRQAEAMLARDGRRPEVAGPLKEAFRTSVRLGALPLRSQIEILARRSRIELSYELGPARPSPGDVPSNRRPPTQVAGADLGLSDREMEVLKLVASGRTNGEIAQELFITTKTASSHVTHILNKLGVANRVAAAMIAARAGILAEGDSS